ncbi:MAG: hypothetical protein M3036_04325 [Bifidobacteriales bacterium]|uniref:hypothetical protein n=1 Tax=Bifidobacterium mellis TaxID=1293823 RepID=UPI0012E05618|nr:hypothetical protein [Bifidobacterium mellis]MCT6836863.1 hypothetical protein [Bifidobacteriales bacterium]
MLQGDALVQHEPDFVPAPEDQCDTKRWYNDIDDLYGNPMKDARRITKTWKRGPHLQKFYTAILLKKQGKDEWSAPEADCNHGVCHLHPNGHHPPSGVKKRYVEIMQLHCCDDVRKARSKTERVFALVELDLLQARENGGDWDEQRIAEFAVRAVDKASH